MIILKPFQISSLTYRVHSTSSLFIPREHRADHWGTNIFQGAKHDHTVHISPRKWVSHRHKRTIMLRNVVMGQNVLITTITYNEVSESRHDTIIVISKYSRQQHTLSLT